MASWPRRCLNRHLCCCSVLLCWPGWVGPRVVLGWFEWTDAPRSAIHLPNHDVDAAHDGRHVGDEATPAKFVGEAEIAETRRSSPYSQRHRILGRPADDIETHLTARTLRFLVRLSGREMAGWLDTVRALGTGIARQSLLDDLDAFHNLDHPNVIPMPGVADHRFRWGLRKRRHDHLEFVLFVTAVRLDPTKVPFRISLRAVE